MISDAYRHLDDLEAVVNDASFPPQARSAFHDRLAECSKQFGLLQVNINDAIAEEARLASGSAPAGDAGSITANRVIARNIGLALHCARLQKDLATLHKDIGKHLHKPSLARTVALAIGGLLALAAAATLAVLIFPVVTGAAAGGGFLLLGAMAAGGASTAGGMAAVALCVKELFTTPSAYRNITRRQPDLAKLMAGIGDGVHQWLRENPGAVAPLDDETLQHIGIEVAEIQRFRSAVLASTLPETVKSLVRIPVSTPTSEQPSSADRQLDMLARRVAKVVGIGKANSVGGEEEKGKGKEAPEDSGKGVQALEDSDRDSGFGYWSGIAHEADDDGSLEIVDMNAEDAPVKAIERRELAGSASRRSSRSDEHGAEQSGENTETPMQALARMWNQMRGDILNVPEGSLDPANHVAVVEEPHSYLSDPAEASRLWVKFSGIVSQRLHWMETCVKVLNDPHFKATACNTAFSKEMDRLARIWIVDLLGVESDLIAGLHRLHPGSFLDPVAFSSYRTIAETELKKDAKPRVEEALEFAVKKNALAVPFDSLPESEQAAARQMMQGFQERAANIALQLKACYEQFPFTGRRVMGQKLRAYHKNAVGLPAAVAKLLNETNRRE